VGACCLHLCLEGYWEQPHKADAFHTKRMHDAVACAPSVPCARARPAVTGLPRGCVQVPNVQVRTYVHGTLYSLLSRPAILERAHQRGLSDALRAVSATSEPVFQRHITHILQRIDDGEAGALVGEESDGEEEGDEDDVDMMEYGDEFDEMEEVMASGAAPSNGGHCQLELHGGCEYAC
jgi:hypothetical protein